MAHHRNRGSLWRGSGIGQTARTFGAADALGDRSGRDSTCRTARNVWLHDQEFSSRTRRPEWINSRFTRFEKFHELRTEPRSKVWLGERRERSSELRRHHEETRGII